MIQYKTGNLLKAEAEALVNTVNCVGVMGRGIALQFQKAYPDNFEIYKKLCNSKQMQVGKVFVFDRNSYINPKYIINFPTKKHWRGKSKIEDIQKGLQSLIEEIQQRHIRSIAIPPLGCGLGGLRWEQVRPLIEKAFESLPQVEVQLFEPKGAPEAEDIISKTQKPKMTVGRAALIELMQRYTAPLLDECITLLEIHKLMYFMQEAGEKLKLKYEKGSYGPYSTNLRHVLHHIEGHYLLGFGEGSENPYKRITLLKKAHQQAETFLKNHPETERRFSKVSKLIEGFETPYGMELLSSIHWIVKHELQHEDAKYDSVMDKINSWSPRKKNLIKPKHITIALDRLSHQGWI
jgi:O-acetyl-ADP-ribose deacetylase (regulator of RNase III)